MHESLKRSAVAAICAIFSTAALPQTPPAPTPPETIFVSAADVAALIVKTRDAHKPGSPLDSAPLLQLAPYRANLEYRTAVGPASVHVKEAELFVVIDGSASLTTGGRLLEAVPRGTDNITGKAIEGGTRQKVGKGDLLMVPENTPHWFDSIDGTLVLMTLHVPRPVPAAQP
jgi:mannose-6-phosphate isomerase-like protein (cupin superfamily)